MDWNLNSFAWVAFATFASIFLLQFISEGDDGPWTWAAVFFIFASALGVLNEPEGLPGAVFGALPYVAYQIYVRTPVGRRRRAAEAQRRFEEFSRLEKAQQRQSRFEAAELSRKHAAIKESIEWISLRTQTENASVMGPTGGRHRPLYNARRALEGGLFFDFTEFSIDERLQIERKAGPIRHRNASRLSDFESAQARREQKKRYSSFSHRPPRTQPAHRPVGPRVDDAVWARETELWTLYHVSDGYKLQLALESVHSKCRRCGRPVSVQNKVEAMALVARTFELPEELYWRQAITNTMWHNKRWKIEPSDLLHSKTSPLSAAARHNALINTVDTSDLNSPYPYWAHSQAGAEGLLANFWNEGEKFSEENWEAASKLAAAAPLIDDCLDCATISRQPKRSRVQLSPRDREAVLMRDGYRCRHCGRNPREDGIKLHVDHIEPWSKGGTNDLENLQALCEECNLGKSDQEIV